MTTQTVNTIAEFEVIKSQTKALAKNLRMLLKVRHVTESVIAQSLNIPVMTVRRIVSGETEDPRISTLKLIADYFKVSLDSLIEDNSDNHIAQMGKNISQFIPVLDWKTIEEINSFGDINLQTWKEWHPIVFGDQFVLSKNAFALESRPSMQPRFPLGTFFVIDPNEIPNDSDIALIRMNNSRNVSLRELVIDSPRWQLSPVVSGSEILFYEESQHTIMGIVVLTLLQTRKDNIAI